jgi:hypothetical protein
LDKRCPHLSGQENAVPLVEEMLKDTGDELTVQLLVVEDDEASNDGYSISP